MLINFVIRNIFKMREPEGLENLGIHPSNGDSFRYMFLPLNIDELDNDLNQIGVRDLNIDLIRVNIKFIVNTPNIMLNLQLKNCV